MYVTALVRCGEYEEDLRVIMECFVEVRKRRGPKVNGEKSKLMVFGREVGRE